MSGTVIVARPAAGSGVDVDDFVDITDATVVDISWVDDGLRVEFDQTLTSAQIHAVYSRIVAVDRREEELRTHLGEYLIAPPTTIAGLTAWLSDVTRLVLGTDPTGQEPSS